MKIAITEQFLDDLTNLQSGLTRKCKQFLRLLQDMESGNLHKDLQPGWRFHKLQSSPFASFSLDMNYRILAKLEGETAFMHRIVKHDLADQARINRNDNRSSTFGVQKTKLEIPDIYNALSSLGLSEERITCFKKIRSEDDLLSALGQADEKTAEFALGLYETSEMVIPRTKYTFLQKDSEFELSLSGNQSIWELYLHPSQKYIASLPLESRASISGSAGTGKTVCAWYRAQFINSIGRTFGFVCPNEKVLNISKKKLAFLITRNDVDAYYLVPSSANDLELLASKVDHIILDEGQEMSPEWYRKMAEVLKKNNTGLTLFFDINQLYGNIEAGDKRRFEDRVQRWNSAIQSIPKCTPIELFINYRNSREIAQYYFEALREVLPCEVKTELPAFESGAVVEQTVNDDEGLIASIVTVIKKINVEFPFTDIGLIHPGWGEERLETICKRLAAFHIPVQRKIEDATGVLVASARDIKGYERRAVIACVSSRADNLQKYGRAIDAYVAMSRARDKLIVFKV